MMANKSVEWIECPPGFVPPYIMNDFILRSHNVEGHSIAIFEGNLYLKVEVTYGNEHMSMIEEGVHIYDVFGGYMLVDMKEQMK